MEHLRPVDCRHAVGGFLPHMPELLVQAEACIAFLTLARCSKTIRVIASIEAPAAGGRQGKFAAHSLSRRLSPAVGCVFSELVPLFQLVALGGLAIYSAVKDHFD
jgi:hypothetical protein